MRRRDLLRSSATLASSIALGNSSALGHQVAFRRDGEQNVLVIARNEFQEFWSMSRDSIFTNIIDKFPVDFICTQENINTLSKIKGDRTCDFMKYFQVSGYVTDLNNWRNRHNHIFYVHTKFINGLVTFNLKYTSNEQSIIFYDRKTFKNGVNHSIDDKPSWINIGLAYNITLYWYLLGVPYQSLILEESNTYFKKHLLEDLFAEFMEVFGRPLELPSEFSA